MFQIYFELPSISKKLSFLKLASVAETARMSLTWFRTNQVFLGQVQHKHFLALTIDTIFDGLNKIRIYFVSFHRLTVHATTAVKFGQTL